MNPRTTNPSFIRRTVKIHLDSRVRGSRWSLSNRRKSILKETQTTICYWMLTNSPLRLLTKVPQFVKWWWTSQVSWCRCQLCQKLFQYLSWSARWCSWMNLQFNKTIWPKGLGVKSMTKSSIFGWWIHSNYPSWKIKRTWILPHRKIWNLAKKRHKKPLKASQEQQSLSPLRR